MEVPIIITYTFEQFLSFWNNSIIIGFNFSNSCTEVPGTASSYQSDQILDTECNVCWIFLDWVHRLNYMTYNSKFRVFCQIIGQ